jgi:hypothetical protein
VQHQTKPHLAIATLLITLSQKGAPFVAMEGRRRARSALAASVGRALPQYRPVTARSSGIRLDHRSLANVEAAADADTGIWLSDGSIIGTLKHIADPSDRSGRVGLEHCLMDLKEAVKAQTPHKSQVEAPQNYAERVIAGAKRLSSGFKWSTRTRMSAGA